MNIDIWSDLRWCHIQLGQRRWDEVPVRNGSQVRILQDGIPGLASPYPRGGASTVAGTDNLLKSFDLYPDVYVLPGQVYQILYTAKSDDSGSTTVVACFVKYTLYDGPDALIANKLLELGVTINPNNVDWYKRSLIEQQQKAAAAAAAAAAGGQA